MSEVECEEKKKIVIMDEMFKKKRLKVNDTQNQNFLFVEAHTKIIARRLFSKQTHLA